MGHVDVAHKKRHCHQFHVAHLHRLFHLIKPFYPQIELQTMRSMCSRHWDLREAKIKKKLEYQMGLWVLKHSRLLCWDGHVGGWVGRDVQEKILKRTWE